MSRAFTKEDDNASFDKPVSSTMRVAGPFHLTERGAAILRASTDPQHQEALAFAEIVAPPEHPERAVLGVTVRVRDEDETEHEYRLVSAIERALLGTSRPEAGENACSIEGPIGRALLGAEVGDIREVRLPRGGMELEVIALL